MFSWKPETELSSGVATSQGCQVFAVVVDFQLGNGGICLVGFVVFFFFFFLHFFFISSFFSRWPRAEFFFFFSLKSGHQGTPPADSRNLLLFLNIRRRTNFVFLFLHKFSANRLPFKRQYQQLHPQLAQISKEAKQNIKPQKILINLFQVLSHFNKEVPCDSSEEVTPER